MKREGRIHGAIMREGKRQWGYGHGASKATGRPTSQSKCTAKRPLGAVPLSVATLAESGAQPAQKSMGKIKHAFKAKDLDITRNYLMQDWKVYEGRNRQASAADDEAEDEDRSGEDEDEEAEEVDEAETNYWDAYCEHWDDRPGAAADEVQRAEMVVPIESLLSMRKRNSKRNAAKARLAAAAAAGQQQSMAVGASGSAGDESGDEFESWWGLGLYDGEEVSDDWFLITEEEGFVA